MHSWMFKHCRVHENGCTYLVSKRLRFLGMCKQCVPGPFSSIKVLGMRLVASYSSDNLQMYTSAAVLCMKCGIILPSSPMPTTSDNKPNGSLPSLPQEKDKTPCRIFRYAHVLVLNPGNVLIMRNGLLLYSCLRWVVRLTPSKNSWRSVKLCVDDVHLFTYYIVHYKNWVNMSHTWSVLQQNRQYLCKYNVHVCGWLCMYVCICIVIHRPCMFMQVH